MFVASRRAAEIVHREMASLHPLILESLDDIGKSQVRKLLERLQVKCLTSRDLIKHHIMPALQRTQNKSVREDFFLSILTMTLWLELHYAPMNRPFKITEDYACAPPPHLTQFTLAYLVAILS
jgi:hypothetical protein